ncbi:hypothetical protein [Pseudomonas pseudonitroreducens]|uniref:hypothetical protein n=1 Tax=Pseudomonas pseudonitroreducens TaxID=2892326 RepID=UPI001F159859|nr:hypothetical protein [Pseudomonas pseudonitroreducens]
MRDHLTRQLIGKSCSMRRPLCAAICAFALLPSFADADDRSLEDTFAAFSRCDAQFFSSLQANADAWKSLAPLGHSASAAWIAVGNRASGTANSVNLKNSPTLAGLKLLSYFDESSDLGTLGRYLYWGFMVDASPDKVAQQLSPLIADRERLQQDGPAYVRSEVKAGDRWLAVRTQSGSAPGTNRLERVLLLEPEGPRGAQTRVSCSLQGAIDGELLAELRPDIPPAEYPRPTALTPFDNVAVPQTVLKNLETSLLQPRFKSLTYTFQSRKDNGERMTPVTVRFEAKDGLLRKTEIYSDKFWVDRLTQANLIQLKSKMNGVGDGRVLLTQSLEYSLPLGWILGRTLKANLVMEEFPAKPGDEPSESELSCKIGQRFPARDVFASLAGDAIRLECIQGNYRTTRAFIEDLGVALDLESTSGSTHQKNEIASLEFSR